MKTLRLLSRTSDLARLQTRLVADTLRARWPGLEVEMLTRSSEGDRDSRVALWTAADKGLFTADLSDALRRGVADAAVHSWKDLPIETVPGTVVAATLERADPRDVLLVRRAVLSTKPPVLAVLTSSPRRGWQLTESIRPLLPWPVTNVELKVVRGNIPTRLRKLIDGEADALVVAKAALDRLLSDQAPAGVRASVRGCLEACTWMVLPVSRFPTAPAQGALAIEVAEGRADVIDLVRSVSHGPTERAVRRERAILQTYGGGCHEAIGVTALPREYGDIVSMRGRPGSGPPIAAWTIEREDRAAPKLDVSLVWPRPDERAAIARRALDVPIPADPRGLLVARAEALPPDCVPVPDRIVWAAGTRTWERLSARGIWVHGCSDGLGDDEEPRIDTLAGEQVRWLRLTHEGAPRLDDGEAVLATYVVERALPPDLGRRQAFFWTSGSLFLEALRRHPAVASGWHASGPGRTAATIRTALSDPGRASIWLDYDAWLQHVTR